MTEDRLYRHVKTGHYYIVLNDHVYIEKTGEQAVAYHRLHPDPDEPKSHRVWIRPYDEFMDGRFKRITLVEKKKL